MKKHLFSLAMLVIFETVAVSLFLAKGNIFYLLNFSYIGVCLAVGLTMFSSGVKCARHFTQLAIGSYMLVYLGFVCKENMQIEGFWYYMRLGVFEAAAIHYAVAKIFGPLLFGRGWCGYACWTAMIFDLLPYKHYNATRKKIGFIRLITFAISLAIVACLFVSDTRDLDDVMSRLLVLGNALYYAAGIIMALAFKDNRAFCKYVCPVTVFLKPMSYFSLLRVHCDEHKCIKCGKCLKSCPMDVEANRESRKRQNATECILCYECVKACPVGALH